MEIIILAAGMGTRMNNVSKITQIPKCLVTLNNHRTIIELNLENIQSIGGTENINIVTGFKHNLVKEHLGNLFPNERNIKIIYNSNFQKSIIHSVLKGFESIKNTSSVLLLNGDTYFDKEIFMQASEIANQELDTITLFGHITNEYYDDDMLINVVERKIVDVGKDLKKANGVSSGAIFMSNGGLKKYLDTINSEPIDQWKTHHGILQCIRDSGCDIDFVDLGSRNWLEIDEQADLDRARRYFAIN